MTQIQFILRRELLMNLFINPITLAKLSLPWGLILFSNLCFAAKPLPLDRLQQAIATEQYALAWETANGLKHHYEGEPAFDYLYGLAALETGHFDYALLALKRAVSNQPEEVRPRLELARTYLALNNPASATLEFKTALELPMPAPVRHNVEQQLQALTAGKQPSTSRSAWQSSASFALGYDNNVNLGVNNASINLPIFGEVTLDNSSIKQDSSFNELSAQLSYNRMQTADRAWFVNTNLTHKHYPHALAYSTKDLNLNAGQVFLDGNTRYQVGMNLQALNLREQPYSRSQALEASVNYKQDLSSSWLAAINWGSTDYQQTANKNQNNQILQLNTQYQFSANELGQQIGFAVSHEIPKQHKFKYLNRDVISLGYGLTKTWNPKQTSSIGVNAQRRVNQDLDLTYRAKRKDRRLTLQITHQIQLSPKASFFTNAGYVNNASNLDLYDSEKAFIKTGIHYQF